MQQAYKAVLPLPCSLEELTLVAYWPPHLRPQSESQHQQDLNSQLWVCWCETPGLFHRAGALTIPVTTYLFNDYTKCSRATVTGTICS